MCANERVAVLLAAYNGERYLRQQVESILSQENVAVTVYISVDQSLDSTEGIASALQAENGSVQLLQGNYRHGSAANNFFHLLRSVDFTDYGYVAFSDQDDIWLEGKLSRAIDEMRAKEADCYASDLTCFEATPGGIVQSALIKSQDQKKFDFLFQGASAGCTYVIKPHCLEGLIEFIDSSKFSEFSHDWLIYAFTRSRGFKWTIDSTSSILYRQHGANVQGARKGLSGFLSKFRQASGTWYWSHILSFEPLFDSSSDERVILGLLRCGSFRSRIRLLAQVGLFRRRSLDVFLLGALILFRRVPGNVDHD